MILVVNFGLSLQVGKGTIEIVTEPANDLNELADIYEEAMDHLIAAAADFDAKVLGYCSLVFELRNVECIILLIRWVRCTIHSHMFDRRKNLCVCLI